MGPIPRDSRGTYPAGHPAKISRVTPTGAVGVKSGAGAEGNDFLTDAAGSRRRYCGHDERRRDGGCPGERIGGAFRRRRRRRAFLPSRTINWHHLASLYSWSVNISRGIPWQPPMAFRMGSRGIYPRVHTPHEIQYKSMGNFPWDLIGNEYPYEGNPMMKPTQKSHGISHEDLIHRNSL